MQRSTYALAGAALLILSLSLHAQDTPADAVFVTATRLDEVTKLPASVTVIPSEEIQKSSAKSLPELLALQPGVSNRSFFGNYGVRDSIDMRGFGATAGQNTLILLDGRRLNDVDLAAVDFPAIPLNNIERIEILRGTGAVLYGDSAVGGTINIVTKSPGRTGTSGSATATAGSYDTTGLDALVSYGKNTFGANVFANHLRSDGYRQNNSLEQNNLFADLRWTEPKHEWFLKLGGDDQNLRLPGPRRVEPGAGINQLETDRRGTNTPNDFANQTGAQLTAGVLAFVDGDTRLTLDGGYRRKNQKAFFASAASYLDTELATWSLTPRLATNHSLFGARTHSIAGIDFYHTYYDSDRSDSPATVGNPIHRIAIDQNNLGIYAQTTSTIADNTDVTAGIRLQHVTLKASDNFNPTASGAAFESGATPLRQDQREPTYELGIRRQLSAPISVFARVGRSARFATVDELFEFDPTTFVRVFSPLLPQTAKSIDAGADYSEKNRKLSASAYYMDLHNEIHFNPITFTNDNLDPTRRYGFLFSADERLSERVRARIDYTHTRSQFVEGVFAGGDVPLVPRNTGTLSIFWDPLPRGTLAAAARYTGSKRFDNDQSNTFAKIPAYAMVDLKYTQTVDAWRWQVAINNVFDKKAFDYGVRSTFIPDTFNAFPLPERNYILSVTRQF